MKLSRQALIALGVTGAGMLSAADLTREQLNKMLETTAKKPVTSELHMGAMCYRSGPLQDLTAEYLCPVCQTKTHHIPRMVRDTTPYRAQIKRIKKLGLEVSLDETDLCSQCRRDKTANTADIYIVVTVGKRSVRTQLEYYDLEKIIAFLEKKDVWKDGQDATRPLITELPRIRKILGMDEASSQADKSRPESK